MSEYNFTYFDNAAFSHFCSTQFILLHFSQSSSSITWCVTWAVNQTFNVEWLMFHSDATLMDNLCRIWTPNQTLTPSPSPPPPSLPLSVSTAPLADHSWRDERHSSHPLVSVRCGCIQAVCGWTGRSCPGWHHQHWVRSVAANASWLSQQIM